MQFQSRHAWEVTPQEAIAIQEELRKLVICQDRLGGLETVAGVDVGFEEDGKVMRAAIVVLSFSGLEKRATSIARRRTSFPYIPGLLSFREAPAILDALSQLESLPDLLMCDGQGLAHPRRVGLACHLGLLCDLPSIGVGKSRLVGQNEPVGEERGQRQPLMDKDELIGMALRTRTGVKPVFVSIGHRVSLDTAVDIVLRSTPQYRLPEPIRQAHRLASGK
jgi:deoxyribonuclease V